MFQKILFKIILKSRLSKNQELHFKQNSSLSSICCPQQFISIYTVLGTIKGNSKYEKSCHMLHLNMCQAANSLNYSTFSLPYLKKTRVSWKFNCIEVHGKTQWRKNFLYHNTDISLHYTSSHAVALLPNLASLSLSLFLLYKSCKCLDIALTVKTFEFSPFVCTHIGCETTTFNHVFFLILGNSSEARVTGTQWSGSIPETMALLMLMNKN